MAELLAPSRRALIVDRPLARDGGGGAGAAGSEDVEHRVMDMQAIDLPDASVDAVVCRFGYMLVPGSGARAPRDAPRAAARRAARVRDLGAREAEPLGDRFGPVLLERGLMEPPQPGEPGQFALGEPERIEELVRGAGFETVAHRGGRARVPMRRAGRSTAAS